MLGLLNWFLEKFDPLRVEEFLRQRNNRSTASKLFYILIVTYEIIEIYEVLLDELKADLDAKTNVENKFWINPARFATLLTIQSDNLSRLEKLTREMYTELKLLNKNFKRTYDEIYSGKFGALTTLCTLLSDSRLPTNEFSKRIVEKPEEYRTLWFTWEAPAGDRNEITKYLHGFDGSEKTVIDVNNHDGTKFYAEIQRYFRDEKPFEKLSMLQQIAESLRHRLEENFQLSDIIGEIGKIESRRNWASKKGS